MFPLFPDGFYHCLYRTKLDRGCCNSPDLHVVVLHQISSIPCLEKHAVNEVSVVQGTWNKGFVSSKALAKKGQKGLRTGFDAELGCH